MAQNIYTMEAVNLICGDVGGVSTPGISTHLTIQELKLPAMEEVYADHNPGGGTIGIEIMTHMNKLEATFNLAGIQPDVMMLLGKSARALQSFTANGLVRDRRTGVALKAQAIMQGRLGRINPTAWSKTNLHAHEYAIKSIVSYSLYMRTDNTSENMTEIYLWDFFTSEFRVGDVDINKDLVGILEIPGVAI